MVSGACPFCNEGFSCQREDIGKSRTCTACKNIFPNSDDPDYLAECARNARELIAAFDGNELDQSDPPAEGMTGVAMTSDPILGSHIQVGEDNQAGGPA